MRTIVWDVDDVLNDLMRVWLEQHWLPGHPGCALKYEQIKGNPPHDLLGVSQEEYLASLDDFRLCGRYDSLKPIEEVRQWFITHGAQARHVALTKVPAATAHVSAAWVMKNFGAWIRSFHFIPSFRTGEQVPAYDENKGAYLNYFGRADLLIDDTMENIKAAEAAGVKALVFPRPWNSSKLSVGRLLDKVTEAI